MSWRRMMPTARIETKYDRNSPTYERPVCHSGGDSDGSVGLSPGTASR